MDFGSGGEIGNLNHLGQEPLWTALARDLARGRLPHAWLLAGPPGAGISRIGLDLTRSLLCGQPNPLACETCPACRKTAHSAHPDLTLVKPQGMYLTIDQSREVAATALLTPNESSRRVFLIQQVEYMKAEAANALLKTIEEPPAWAYFILCTENESKILPTIISRCRQYSFRPWAAAGLAEFLVREAKVEPEEARHLAELAEGRLDLALELASEGYAERLGELQALLQTAWTAPGPAFATQATARLLSLADKEREQLLEWTTLLLGLLRNCWLAAENLGSTASSYPPLPVEKAQLPSAENLRKLVEITLDLLAALRGNVNIDLAVGNFWETVALARTETIEVPVME